MKKYNYIILAIFVLNFCFSVSSFAQTVTDSDNNTYNTIQIGNQVWMSANLKTTHFNDGELIPLVSDNTQWSNLDTPAFCWFNNDTVNISLGALYNWHSVNKGKLCPTGWHVPSDQDWKVLEMQIGLTAEEADRSYWRGGAAGVLKSTSGWNNNGNGSNSSGFNAVPAGYRDSDGEMGTIGDYAAWWTSSLVESNYSLNRGLNDSDNKISRSDNELKNGFSVRCIKD